VNGRAGNPIASPEGKKEGTPQTGPAEVCLLHPLRGPSCSRTYDRLVTLAGIPVRDQDVLELARLLRDAGFDETAEKLEDGYDRETKILA